MSDSDLRKSGNSPFGLASLRITDQPRQKPSQADIEALRRLEATLSPSHKALLEKDTPDMRMSQSIKSPIHFDFDRPEDLTDRHHEFMASTAHLNPLPEGNLYKVMVDNMEERERRKRELKTQLEGFKSENEELKDRIRELLAKLANPTVTLAELEAIKRELNKIIKERDMLNENLKLTTQRAEDLDKLCKDKQDEIDELKKKLREFMLAEELERMFRQCFMSGSNFSKQAPIIIEHFADNVKDIIKGLKLLGEPDIDVGQSPTNKFYQALLLYYWGKSKYKDSFYQSLLEAKPVMNRLVKDAHIDGSLDIRLRGRTMFGHADNKGIIGNNYCLLLLEMFTVWKTHSQEKVIQNMYQTLHTLSFLEQGMFDNKRIDDYQNGFELIPLLEPPPQAEVDKYIEKPPQDKINTNWHRFKVLTFYLQNIFKPLVIGLIGALTVSGITDNTKRDYILVFVGIYLVLTLISMCRFYNAKPYRFNYWTAAVLVESYRTRWICRFFPVFIMLFTFIQGVIDWAKCRNNMNAEVGIDNNTSCANLNPVFNFILACGLVVVGLIQLLTYVGPFFETMPMCHKLFYKLDMSFDAFSCDSALLLKNLRVIAYITKSESIEFTVTSVDIPWGIVNFLTKDDKLMIYSFFENQDDDETDPDYDGGPVPYVIMGCIIPYGWFCKHPTRKEKIAELHAKAEKIHQSKLVKVERKAIAQAGPAVRPGNQV